tara:strand:- start:525 stop:1409 length:885 start_codon:yes stop_codon:yes gene_type:complete
MKKIFEGVYLLSKFSISIILLFCLLTLIYIFFIGYKKNENLEKSQLYNDKELREKIDQNSNLIIEISKELKKNNDLIKEVEDNLLSQPSLYSEEITTIKKNLENLNENLSSLKNDIKKINVKSQNLEITNNDTKTNIIEKSKDEILDLILLKYVNNLSYDSELSYLSKNFNNLSNSSLEKIYSLNDMKYKGHDYLKNKFDEEINNFLKERVNKSSTFINKILLPYVKISPSSENSINDDLLLKIERVKKFIINENIDKAYNNLILIDNYEKIFIVSYFEMNNYRNFKAEIDKLK